MSAVFVPSNGQFICRIPRLFLAPGRYRIGARVLERGEEADWPRDGVGYLEVEGGDYYGTAVNLAARVRAEAEPDQILVTEEVYQRARSDLSGSHAKAYRLKGFEAPIELYAA